MKNPINKAFVPAFLLGACRRTYTISCAKVDKNGLVDLRTKDFMPSKKLDSNMCFSVSKSVVSLALGFAYDRGLFDPTDPIAKYLGDFFPEGVDKKWYDVKAEDVLRHRTGTDFAVDLDWVNAGKWEDKEWLHRLFSYPISGKTGTDYRYSDSNYYIAARIFSKIMGQEADEFLRDNLFEPMGFYYYAWAKDNLGHVLGGTGLYLRTEDLARLGALWLGKGTYEGVRYLSEKWIDLCMAPCDETLPQHNYGFGVRTFKDGTVTITGMKGQEIFFNKNRDFVFAWQGQKQSALSYICPVLMRLRLI